MSQAVVGEPVVEGALVHAPQSSRGILTSKYLAEMAEQRKLLKLYIQEQMVDGVDYGIIPGTEKRTLFKPGAEKLVDLFRCEPEYEILKEEENWDTNLFSYRFCVKLVQAGAVLAVGYGSANSREARYRYRHQNAKCPRCGAEALLRSKKEEGEAFCWAKKGGCGGKFNLLDDVVKKAFEGAGKVENDDVATLVNTILKMAKKRALVDGAIAMARVSDIFTQDVEDMPRGMQVDDDRQMSEEDELAAEALSEEFKTRMAAEGDARKLWRITEEITAAMKKGRITSAQQKDLAGFYKTRAEQIKGGAK